jgi:hypothetical protein
MDHDPALDQNNPLNVENYATEWAKMSKHSAQTIQPTKKFEKTNAAA